MGDDGAVLVQDRPQHGQVLRDRGLRHVEVRGEFRRRILFAAS
jgi:hypothetical protein